MQCLRCEIDKWHSAALLDRGCLSDWLSDQLSMPWALAI